MVIHEYLCFTNISLIFFVLLFKFRVRKLDWLITGQLASSLFILNWAKIILGLNFISPTIFYTKLIRGPTSWIQHNLKNSNLVPFYFFFLPSLFVFFLHHEVVFFFFKLLFSCCGWFGWGVLSWWCVRSLHWVHDCRHGGCCSTTMEEDNFFHLQLQSVSYGLIILKKHTCWQFVWIL